MAGASCFNIEAHREPTRKADYSWAGRDSESGRVKPTAAGPLRWFANMTGISSLCSRKLEFYSSFYGGAEPALPPHVSAVPHHQSHAPYGTALYFIHTCTQHTYHTRLPTNSQLYNLTSTPRLSPETHTGRGDERGGGGGRERAVEHQGRRTSQSHPCVSRDATHLGSTLST